MALGALPTQLRRVGLALGPYEDVVVLDNGFPMAVGRGFHLRTLGRATAAGAVLTLLRRQVDHAVENVVVEFGGWRVFVRIRRPPSELEPLRRGTGLLAGVIGKLAFPGRVARHELERTAVVEERDLEEPQSHCRELLTGPPRERRG